MSEYQHLEDVLTGFQEARALIKERDDSIRSFGYVGSKFDFYRFVNRFRLAVSFKGVEIENFGDETAETYGALTKLFLTWSTFEMYCSLCNKPYYMMFHNYPKLKTIELARRYWKYDQDGVMIYFLIEHTFDHGQAHILRQFRDGHQFRAITVAACMRHIYAHGHLTAHPNGMTASDTRHICDLFSDFITEFIREDFKRRLKQAVHSQ